MHQTELYNRIAGKIISLLIQRWQKILSCVAPFHQTICAIFFFPHAWSILCWWSVGQKLDSAIASMSPHLGLCITGVYSTTCRVAKSLRFVIIYHREYDDHHIHHHPECVLLLWFKWSALF